MSTACMGGWCRVRDRCDRYRDTDAPEYAERLCIRGVDAPVWSRERLMAAAVSELDSADPHTAQWARDILAFNRAAA